MRGDPPPPPPSEGDHRDTSRPGVERTVTELPRFIPTAPVQANRVAGAGGHNHFSLANDGVFANLNAKPERGEKLEEQPPVNFLCFFPSKSHTLDHNHQILANKILSSLTNKRRQMQHLPIGKTPFSLQASHPVMKSTLTVYPSVPCSVSCGMA